MYLIYNKNTVETEVKQVYNNNPDNMNYNYGTPYRNNSFYNMFGDYNPIIDKEAVDIRKHGMIAGGAILGALVMRSVATIIMQFLGLTNLFLTDANYMNGIGVYIQIFYLFIPFLFAFALSSKDDRSRMMIFGKPKSKELYLFGVFAGLMFCIVANYASSFLDSLFDTLGVEFLSGAEDIPVPQTAAGWALMVINDSAAPALLEEFAFRCVLLQPLRKYGDKFAIVVTSVAFALMHGNMVQIPFAFIAGLALGYFCVMTESIWTSVTIHFANNLLSVIFSVYYDRNPDASGIAYMIISAALFVLGIFALILFINNKSKKLHKVNSELSPAMKRGLYLCTPTLVLAFIDFTSSTIKLQNTNSPVGMMVLIALLAAAIAYLVKNILLIRRDRRITKSGAYTASLVFSLAWAFIGTLTIVFASFVSLNNFTVTP